MKGLLAIISFLFLSLSLFSQHHGVYPLNNEYNEIIVGGLADEQYNFHPSIKPYDPQQIDSIYSRLFALDIETKSKVIDVLLNADSITPKKGRFNLGLTPIFNAVYATGNSNDSSDQAYNLGIGLMVHGFVGQKFTFGFDYTYSSNQYADYVENQIDETGVIPGMGKALRRGESFNNKMYSGYGLYQPVEYLKIQAGVGKHFIGHGYRSLLLSDNSFVYPYLKINLDIWKFNYQVLYSFHENLTYDYPSEVETKNQKYSTSNYLSMNIGKKVNVGLFQTVIWYNNEEVARGFDVNYLNPVVFLRPVEFSIGSPDNILMGLDARYKFYKNYSIYTQVILDEFLLDEVRANNGWWGNKYGLQFGIKGYDVFGVKGLSFLAEYNWVRPFTYSHGNVFQNYGHYNESLAHTLGSNFYEVIGRINYVKNRWLFSFHGVMAEKGIDQINPNDPLFLPSEEFYTNYGGNIFRSNADNRNDYKNKIGQGLSTRRQYFRFNVSYLLSPDARWMLEAGVSYRKNLVDPNRDFGDFYSEGFDETNTMFHIGIKTALYNQYLDF